MNKLIYNPDFVVELPNNELKITFREYLGDKVKDKINNGIDIKSFLKYIAKDEKICFILTVVDDSNKNSGNKRNDILNRNNKYIGISSVKIGKSFACYINLEYKPLIQEKFKEKYLLKNQFCLVLDYISYYFERITDVEKQEGVSNDYTENFHIFLLINDKKHEKKKKKKIKMKFEVERKRGCLRING